MKSAEHVELANVRRRSLIRAGWYVMLLTRNACYALIAVSHLARGKHGACNSAAAIAELCGVPRETLAKVLQRLARAHVLVSHYGAKGGYELARPADEIPALEVIWASEPDRSSRREHCSHHLRIVYEMIESSLRINISDLNPSLSGGDHPSFHERAQCVQLHELRPI